MIREHKYEMIRYAKSPEGAKAWARTKAGSEWVLGIPLWKSDRFYVVDDLWAEIAKQFIDDKSKVEIYDYDKREWEPTALKDIEYLRINNVGDYRIKSDGPVYYYQWEKCMNSDILLSDYTTTDHTAEGWFRIDESKRTWDH